MSHDGVVNQFYHKHHHNLRWQACQAQSVTVTWNLKLYFGKNVNWVDACKIIKIWILTAKHFASQQTQAVNNQQREKFREPGNKQGSLCLHAAKSWALRLTRTANARPAQGRSQKSLQSGQRETLFCADCIVCCLGSVNLMCVTCSWSPWLWLP